MPPDVITPPPEGAPPPETPPEGAPPPETPPEGASPPETPPEGAPPPETSPAGSWRDGLPDTMRGDPFFNQFDSVEALAKRSREMDAAIGKKGLLPPDAGNPEAMTEFLGSADYRKAMGVPDTVDGYEIPVPEGHELSPFEEALHTGMKQAAHKYGMTPLQLKGAVAEVLQPTIDQFNETAKQTQQQAINTLKSRWGGEFDAKVQAGTAIAERLWGERWAAMSQQRMADGSYLVDNAPFVEGLIALGEVVGEDALVQGGLPPDFGSPQAAHVEWKNLRQSPAYKDDKHPEHKVARDKAQRIASAFAAKWHELGLER